MKLKWSVRNGSHKLENFLVLFFALSFRVTWLLIFIIIFLPCLSSGPVYREGSLQGTVLFQWEKFLEEKLFRHMQIGLTRSPVKWSRKYIQSGLSITLQLYCFVWRVLPQGKKTQSSQKLSRKVFCPLKSSSSPQTSVPHPGVKPAGLSLSGYF